MSETTANLEMPYILPSQAQKHVTHNEALQRLDAVTQLTITASLATPPATPAEGDCYFVAASPTGAFSGKSGKLAFRQDGSWIFITPKRGWRAWFVADDSLKIHDGSGFAAYDALATHAVFGINTSADATNRLAVSADATLLTHDGDDHRLKINKAGPTDTASLLFQSGWSGRAEMGLAGNDAFSIKVSGDGSTWQEALTVGAAGRVLMPNRPLARATRGGGLVTPSSGSQTGFSTFAINQGGFSLGASVAGGGNRLIIPETAPYLVCLSVEANPAGAFSVDARVNGTTTIASVRDNDAATASYNMTAIGLAMLTAGDWLVLEHTGSTPIDFGLGKTEISLVML
ncbi:MULTISPECIES: DUF2793 domain-containing protein [unclassified Rhizobium]|uniref:DUF2793 domain-containing protein n=1 Tax=unclassified Rhizobium TaxID=2613769 RepID=UPI0006FA2126|nr:MULTISPECIES: DUF2793 domain-containing protein [unclassified Rhizobium]KQV38119.1 hypothetical protein ASC86_07750 [Rhizobium sp. Root1212]KRD30776.1 hypothetical protein ASE37_07745 [Rhizobium sp. Root268]